MRSRSIPSPAVCLLALLVPIVLLCNSRLSQAAGFSCTNASTLREKTICATPRLSAMDSKLAATYNTELRALSPANAALVRSDQREWLQYLEKVCPPGVKSSPGVAACLVEHYTVRLEQMGVDSHDGMRFFVRSHVVFTSGSPRDKGEIRSSGDPGFSYGEFSWPQIDKPTAAQRAWNEAAYHAAIAAQTSNSGANKTTFESAVDEPGFTYGFSSLRAANHKLIDLNYKTETYGWGAAHPLTTLSSFLWWLDQGRPVTVHDVFEPANQWQTRLTVPTLAGLQKEPGPEALFEGDELSKGIAEGVTQIANWGLSTQGLTITFGQYQVAPYVTGMPSVTLSWEQLQPLLNTAFHPDELPPKLPASD